MEKQKNWFRRHYILTGLIGLFGLFVLFSLLVGVLVAIDIFSGSNPDTSNQYKSDNTTACIMAQKIIRDNYLKSPGSAKFQSCIREEYGGPKVDYFSYRTYRVTTWVDSQNSFGALL